MHRLGNDDLQIIWIDAVSVYSRHSLGICLQESRIQDRRLPLVGIKNQACVFFLSVELLGECVYFVMLPQNLFPQSKRLSIKDVNC